VDIEELRAMLERRGIDAGVGRAGLIMAHAGVVDAEDLQRLWHAVEALRPQA
jgi:hypothetical protein